MTLRTRNRNRRTALARGFSLVELVVVVGIILVLLGLVLAVSTIVIQQAETRQVKTVFANLEAAVGEFELVIGRKMTSQPRGENNDGAWDFRYFNVLGTGVGLEAPFNYTSPGTLCSCNQPTESTTARGWERRIVRLMQMLKGTDASEEIISRIDSNLLIPIGNGDYTAVVDPWGIPIAVVLPGRTWKEGDDGAPDPDGTIRTLFETKMGVCRNATPLFVSAGPDGDIGCVACVDETASPRYQATLDNIYSYEPEVQ